MYVYEYWQRILFNFPFPVSYSFATIYWQSTYFLFTAICSMVIVFYLCLFLKSLPEQYSKYPPGTKYEYRKSFILCVLPTIVSFSVFFGAFFLPYTAKPLPDSMADCDFPLATTFIPFLGVIPGLTVFAFAKVSRVRWGAFSACGFSFLALSLVLNIFIFQYCLGNAPSRRPFYPVVCGSQILGIFFLVYGAIRPNKVHNTPWAPLLSSPANDPFVDPLSE